MKTDKITIFNLFETQRRYLVPIFQRGYVWSKDEQWVHLWDDIADQAELVKSHRGTSKSTSRKHFLGAIVLSHVPTVIKQVPTSEIIDGQQRLLTLQAFLAALRDAVASLDDEYLKTQLGILTKNPGPFFANEEEYKVWPSNAYQEDIKIIISTGSPDKIAALYPQKLIRKKLVPPRPELVEAYLFFHGRIIQYLNNGDEDAINASARNADQEVQKERANLLFEAVKNHIQLVEIQLDAEDDPQVIFETLNYRGVPLEPSDLIRNFIFLQASKEHKDINNLYCQWWKDYDEASGKKGKYWKEKEQQGRLFRSRLDLFFFHYLTYRVCHEIKIGHLYQEFKDWWANDRQTRSIEEELETAKRSSFVFRNLLTPPENDQSGAFAHRIQILDMTTIYPFLLWLYEFRNHVDPEEFNGILGDLESYVLRRAICGLTTKAYNRTFLSLLSKLSKDGAPRRSSLQSELLSLEGETVVWPNNDTFNTHLTYDPLYKNLGPKRLRMVLTALELASRTSHQEVELAPILLNNSLTIEHIMPQGFKPEEWPYAVSSIDDPQAQQAQRYNLLHSLGNLTLLTQPLNSVLSCGPFHLKRPEITGQGLLLLNAYFQKFPNDFAWNEEAIVNRGRLLADVALRVWKYPET
jgi:uncharacterized protein with ParB-like and HNH nuclease domain